MLNSTKHEIFIGISTFMSGKNSILVLSEPRKSRISWYVYTYEHLKFHAQLSGDWQKRFNLEARTWNNNETWSSDHDIYISRHGKVETGNFSWVGSSDCHPNPGPRSQKFQCLSCKKGVRNEQNSVQCETWAVVCETWAKVSYRICRHNWRKICCFDRVPVCMSSSQLWFSEVTQLRAPDISILSPAFADHSYNETEQSTSVYDSSMDQFPAGGISCSTPKKRPQRRADWRLLLLMHRASRPRIRAFRRFFTLTTQILYSCQKLGSSQIFMILPINCSGITEVTDMEEF